MGVAALRSPYVGSGQGTVTVLYLVAITLVSYKVCSDLNAFTHQSSRKTDLAAFLVLAIITVVLALAIPQTLPPFELGCEYDPCWSLA